MTSIHLDTVGDSRPRALIVDRDDDTRSMYATFLGFGVWTADQAEDGREALVKAGSIRYDAIVTETRLPFVSGYDLCERLKHDWMTAGTPIIVVTGDVFAADVARARRMGADAVLLKPCLPDMLTHELNRQLARTRYGLSHCPPATAGPRGGAIGCPDVALRQCPRCDHGLVYSRSHARTGHEAGSRWEDYICPRGCGAFRFRLCTQHLG
jgi:DNA-binding response OmpR family regulator